MSTWYRTGTALFVNGSTSVSGSGTAWIASARTGDALHAPDGRVYEIASVNSNTSITLASEYLGSNASGADYAIQPTRGITVEFNDNAVSLLSTVQSYVDTALAGRFPDGSAGAPSHSFASDTDTGMYRDAADRIGFSAGGARRAFLSTAAMQIDVPVTGTAVTQSPTDTTAGRLLKVGDFGVGAQPSDGDSDLEIDYVSLGRVTFRVDGTLTSLINLPRRTNRNFQLAGSTGGTAARAWVRKQNDEDDFTPWRELYHTGNLIGTVSESSGDPTGAVIERGSNSNGEYVRFADGTQICLISGTDTFTTSSSGQVHRDDSTLGSSWTFPAAFSTSPICAFHPFGSTIWGACGVTSATALSARILWSSVSRSNDSISHRSVAIGRWF